MYWCDNCKKAVRVGIKVNEKGKKVRYCKKCGKEFI
jgi:large subunit ribosomal protein L24